jgi:DNA polymerase III epsilon subunit-like protein
LTSKIHQAYARTKHGYGTPKVSPNSIYKRAPSPCPDLHKRAAVVIDCEMVETTRVKNELARLSAVDFVTGEVLINDLVYPDGDVVDWRSRITGLNPHLMNDALQRGTLLKGWQLARSELWKYIDTDTILVGHSLNHDLKALVVDSAILTSEAVPGSNRQFALVKLCDELIQVPIRTHDGGTHSALEDSFATREVVLWCLNNTMALQAWGRRQSGSPPSKNPRRGGRKKKATQNRQQPAYSRYNDYELDSDDDSIFNVDESDFDDEESHFDVDEFLVECGWPHPDTGYDPWSD